MPHGRPDWYNITPMVQVHASEDLAELSARQDHINVYDRRGNVVHVETFAQGTGGFYTYVTGAASSALSAAYSRTDGLALCCYTYGSTDDVVTLIWTQGIQAALSRGLEVSWSATAQHGIIELGLGHDEGGSPWLGGIRYSYETTTLYYYDSSNNLIVIDATLVLPTDATVWHFCKIAVDFEEHQYLRVLVDNHSYSLAGIGLSSSLWSIPGVDYWIVSAQGGGAVASEYYIDSVIATINEL